MYIMYILVNINSFVLYQRKTCFMGNSCCFFFCKVIFSVHYFTCHKKQTCLSMYIILTHKMLFVNIFLRLKQTYFLFYSFLKMDNSNNLRDINQDSGTNTGQESGLSVKLHNFLFFHIFIYSTLIELIFIQLIIYFTVNIFQLKGCKYIR